MHKIKNSQKNGDCTLEGNVSYHSLLPFWSDQVVRGQEKVPEGKSARGKEKKL